MIIDNIVVTRPLDQSHEEEGISSIVYVHDVQYNLTQYKP